MANRFLTRDYQTRVPSYSLDDLGLDGLFGPSQMPTQSPQQGFGPDVGPMASGMQPDGQAPQGAQQGMAGSQPMFGPDVSPQAGAGGAPQGGAPQGTGFGSLNPQQLQMLLSGLGGLFR